MLRLSLPEAMSIERFLPPLFDVFGRAPVGHSELVNRDALQQLVDLLQAEAEAPGRCILLRAPRAGYGKTHLLNQVERRLAGSHEFVLLTLADGSRMHAGSVLEDLLRKLCRPLPAAAGLTALDLIARRVLARGLEPLVRSGEVPCQDREGAIHALQSRATETFDFHHPNAVTAHWTRENFALLGPRLGLELCEACGGPLREAIGWVDALFRFAAAPADQPARIGNLIEWSSAGASVDRLACLLRLLAPLHRMVLVADEIEGLSSDPEAGLRLAAFVTSLRQTADKADVIIAVNDDLWEGAFRPRLSGGLEDRLAERVVRLNPLADEETVALLENHFPGEGAHLASLLGLGHAGRYARRVLRRAAEIRDALERGSPLPEVVTAAASIVAPAWAPASALEPAAGLAPSPVEPPSPELFQQAALDPWQDRPPTAVATTPEVAESPVADLSPEADAIHSFIPSAAVAYQSEPAPEVAPPPVDSPFGVVAGEIVNPFATVAETPAEVPPLLPDAATQSFGGIAAMMAVTEEESPCMPDFENLPQGIQTDDSGFGFVQEPTPAPVTAPALAAPPSPGAAAWNEPPAPADPAPSSPFERSPFLGIAEEAPGPVVASPFLVVSEPSPFLTEPSSFAADSLASPPAPLFEPPLAPPPLAPEQPAAAEPPPLPPPPASWQAPVAPPPTAAFVPSEAVSPFAAAPASVAPPPTEPATIPVPTPPAGPPSSEPAPTPATPDADRIDDLLRQFRERYGRR